MAIDTLSPSSFGCGCPICMGDRIEETDSGPLGFLPSRGAFVVTPNTKPSLTTEGAGAQITRNNITWNGSGTAALGQATTVTYAFRATAATTYNPGVSGINTFTPQQIAVAEFGLLSWSDAGNITFQRVGSGTSGPGAFSNDASILFTNYTSGADGAAAFAYFPGNRASGAAQGDIYINSSLPYNANPQLNNYGWLTMTHEIGHALGLNHPGDYNAGGGSGPITYNSSAQYYEDTLQYTVMSYFGASFTGSNHGVTGSPNFSGYPSAPMMDDISAIQRLYGANMTTRTGNDVYGFGNATGRPWFDASEAVKPIFAVWDAGGFDTFNFSGFSQAQQIDLRETSFSNVGGLIGNVSIARGVTIEAAIGGSGADLITGNLAANVLNGGAGNDTIDAGGGDDFIFGGAGSDTLNGEAGTDTIGYSEAAQTLFVEQVGGVLRVWQDLIFDAAVGVERAEAAGVLYGSIAAFQAASFSSDFYLASNPGLIAPLDENNPFSAYQHYINYGRAEGRALRSFDALTYLASNPGLAQLFGADAAAGARHYVFNGFAEGRPTTGFDALIYLASNTGLAKLFGPDAQGGLLHYVNFGADENRPTTGFVPLDYAAAHTGLAQVFGLDGFGALLHYLNFGADENRTTGGFDTVAYWLSNRGFGGALDNHLQSRNHWLAFGADEGRAGDSQFGREQTGHAFSGATANGLVDFGGDRDWFVTTLTAGPHAVNLGGANEVLVYNAQGAVVAAYGAGASTFNAPAAGTYYFVVVGGAVGAYSLTVGGASIPAPANDDAPLGGFDFGGFDTAQDADLGSSVGDGFLFG